MKTKLHRNADWIGDMTIVGKILWELESLVEDEQFLEDSQEDGHESEDWDYEDWDHYFFDPHHDCIKSVHRMLGWVV